MSPEQAARRWADTLRETWPSGDVDRFLDLYADDARFRWLPREQESAKEHMRRALTLGDPGVDAWVGEPLVAGNRAAVEWWAVVSFDGEPKTFVGTSWLRFDADGCVTDEHDYVEGKDGRVEPPPGWGRREDSFRNDGC